MHPTAKRTFRISEGDRVRGRTRSPFKDYSSYNPYAHNDFDEKYQTKLEEILEKHAKEQERIIRRMQENSNRRRNIAEKAQQRLERIKAEEESTLAQIKENKRIAYLKYLKQQDHHSILESYHNTKPNESISAKRQSNTKSIDSRNNKPPLSNHRKVFNPSNRESYVTEGPYDSGRNDIKVYRSIVKGVSVFESNLIQYNTHLDLNSPTSTSHHDDIVYTRPTEATERELFWKPLMGIKGTNFVTEDNEYTSHREDWSQWYKDSIRNTPNIGLQKRKDSVYFDDEKSNNKIDMKNRNDLPIIEPKKMILNVKENNSRQMPHLGINNMIHKSPLLHKYKATPSKNIQRLIPRNQNKNSSDLQTDNPFASLKPIKRTMNNSFDTLGIPGHAERKEPLDKNYDEGDEGIDYINSIANSDYKPVIRRPVAGARRKRNDSDPIEYSLFNESELGDEVDKFLEETSSQENIEPLEQKPRLLPNLSFGPPKADSEDPFQIAKTVFSPLINFNSGIFESNDLPLDGGTASFIKKQDSTEILKAIEDKSRMSTSEDSPVKLLKLRNNISTNNNKPPPKLNQAFTLGPTPFTLEDSPVFNNNMSPTFNAQGIQLKTKEDQPDLPKISQEIENENLAQEENQTIEFSGLDKEEKVNQEEEVDKDPLKEDQNEIKIDNPSDNVNHTAEIDHFNPNKEIKEEHLNVENEKEIDIEVKAEEGIAESHEIIENCIEKEFVEVVSSEEKVKAIEQNEPQVQNQDNDSEYYKGLPLDIFFMETEVEEEGEIV